MRRKIDITVGSCVGCPFHQHLSINDDYQDIDHCSVINKKTEIWSGYNSKSKKLRNLELKNWFENLCTFEKES
jgi:hypothetical protein